MTLVADVVEGRDIATLDVGGTFLLVDRDDEVIIRVQVEITKVLCNINGSYRHYTTIKYEKTVLDMRSQIWL